MHMSDMSIIVRHMRVFAERRMSEFDLGFPEMLILMCLSGQKQTNQENIAHQLEVDKGAIAKSILKLETKGLIERQPNPQNRRENLISATPKTKEVLHHLRVVLKEWEDSLYQGIDDDSRKAMHETIALMAKNSTHLIQEGR